MKRLLFMGLCSLLMFGCSPSETEKEESAELVVSAAASLTNAMEDIAEVYEDKHSDINLIFNFAGSGTLAQQIKKGAPVDVFISANENWMQTMIDEDFIDESNKVEVTENRLVLITGKDSDLSIDSFSDLDSQKLNQVAIGNPESVPAGEYTKDVLEVINQWENLEDSFVYAKDVRQVLTYVETGNTDVGFVYESDALSSDKVDIAAYSEPDDHEPIIYPGAVLEKSEQKDEGEKFLAFLQSEEGKKILEDYGFTYDE